ncbi:beta-barrel assembly-enhancing protease [Flocculibacter collagenilyticus]|uniref:beta-barrel assembly-enhancing protease n=1 Tax=Flocculibacter collagenilyticus TaxID=2744479 RepID=UPI0018F61753|nr:M48 family metalloprotease [Flocculibacter collagenilyticus]
MKKITYLALAACITFFSQAPFVNAQSAGTELPDLGASGVSALTIEKEKNLGKLFMRQARAQLPITHDPVLTEYINELGNRLVAHSDGVNFPFTFFIVNDGSVNAFAFFGGHIGIHTGLIELTETESELASVLGHEIAHVTQRHLARSIEARNNNTPLTLAGMIGGILLAAVNPQAGIAAISASQAGGQQASINFTRSNEKEADRIGMQILYQSGYDPHATPSFMSKMANKFRHVSKPPAFLLTHPLPDSRLSDSRLRAEQFGKKDFASSANFGFAKARVLVRYGMSADDAVRHFKQQLNTSENIVNYYGLALALSDAKKNEDAEKIIRKLLEKSPKNLFFLDTYTDILVQQKKYDEVLARLEAEYQLRPNNQVITLNYASAALKAGKPELSARLLKYFLIRFPDHFLATSLLADTYAETKDLAKYHEYKANVLALVSAYPDAIAQLNIALNYLNEKKDELEIKRIEATIKQMRHRLNELKRQ